MAKVRIYELAKETGAPAEDIISMLGKIGIKVKSNLSSIDAEVAARLKSSLKGGAAKAAVVADKDKAAAATPKATPAAKKTTRKAAAKTTKAPSKTTRKAPAATPTTAAPREAAASKHEARKPILIPAPGRALKPAAAKPAAAAPPRPTAARPAAGAKPPARPTTPSTPTARAGAAATGARPAPGRSLPPGNRPGRTTPPRIYPPQRRPGAYPQPHRGRRGPRRPQPQRPTAPPAPPPPPPDPSTFKEITIPEGVTVKELAEKMERKSKDIIKSLMVKGILATINQPLDADSAKKICNEFGFKPSFITFEETIAHEELVEGEDQAEELVPRAPVVTMMGHVDHGKTSLLDAIRETAVAESEHGGITQHIGAYHVDVGERKVVFLDTPGHEAFTRMRARGAQVTDIVVLVVAADDGVMPQTIEAIHHAREADVPLVVAMNKIDKPEANPDRVKKALAEQNVLVEDWGGDVVCVPVSAKQRTGLDSLLEMILLTSDLQESKANPKRLAQGTVLEARLDRARGPVATVLIRTGTLRVGDPFIVGAVSGKVRAMMDDRGNRVEEAGPSTAVEILGMEGVPEAGDTLQALSEDRRARQISSYRQEKVRKERLLKSSKMSLDHLFEQIKVGVIKELRIILKSDVQGSAEVLSKTLQELSTEKVQVKVIHSATGAINDSDVLLATASNAIIVGFNVRPERTAQVLAEKEEVDIRLHTVIYNVTKEIKSAMVGLLEPTFKEVYLGRAEVRATFKVPKAGMVAGCSVVDGRILRTAEVRLLRDNIVIHEGKISSLRRFKDDASEVKQGFECGIGLERFNDIKIGDIIEAFKVEKVTPQEL